MRVGLYCHSSEQIGFGHLSRAVNLARGFQSAGDAVQLFNEGVWPAFIDKNVPICEAPQFLLETCDLVIFDGARADDCLRGGVEKRRPLVAQVDDNGADCDAATVIINPNLYGERIPYPPHKRVLAGPRFNMIPHALFHAAVQVPRRRGIVISFGGSDRGQFGIPLARRLVALGVEITLLLAGERNRYDEFAIGDLEAAGVNVLFAARATDWLVLAELYIGAAGVTAQEALAAQCELVVCSIVDNQVRNVSLLREVGYRALDSFDADQLATAAMDALQTRTVTTSLMPTSGIPRIVDALHESVRRANAGAG